MKSIRVENSHFPEKKPSEAARRETEEKREFDYWKKRVRKRQTFWFRVLFSDPFERDLRRRIKSPPGCMCECVFEVRIAPSREGNRSQCSVEGDDDALNRKIRLIFREAIVKKKL